MENEDTIAAFKRTHYTGSYRKTDYFDCVFVFYVCNLERSQKRKGLDARKKGKRLPRMYLF